MVDFNMSGFDTARTFENILNIYFHMRQKKYLHFTAPSKQTNFNSVHQLNRGLHQVHICIQLYMVQLDFTLTLMCTILIRFSLIFVCNSQVAHVSFYMWLTPIMQANLVNVSSLEILLNINLILFKVLYIVYVCASINE